jgi:hypothetical protein
MTFCELWGIIPYCWPLMNSLDKAGIVAAVSKQHKS